MIANSMVLPKRLLLQRCFSHYYTAEKVFNPTTIEQTLHKFMKLPPKRISSNQPLTKAAVFIPLCEVNGKVSLLYTLRAHHLKAHRGQVSFPGGKHEYNETFEETAVRETTEELGIDPERIEIWGSGKWMSTRKGFSVVPVIGRIKHSLDLKDLHINTSEVQEVFTVPLEDICNPKNLGYTQFRTSISTSLVSIPVFLAGKHRIWGLTGFLTFSFLKCLLPSEAYNHQIIYVPPISSDKK